MAVIFSIASVAASLIYISTFILIFSVGLNFPRAGRTWNTRLAQGVIIFEKSKLPANHLHTLYIEIGFVEEILGRIKSTRSFGIDMSTSAYGDIYNDREDYPEDLLRQYAITGIWLLSAGALASFLVLCPLTYIAAGIVKVTDGAVRRIGLKGG